jgi:hypothetical protein
MVSLSVANDVACLPIAARLYLPEALTLTHIFLGG